MEFRISNDPVEFDRASRSWLSSEPYSSNVIGTLIEGLLNRSRAVPADWAFITVLEGDAVIGAAMHTPPFPVFLPRLAPEIATALAEHLVTIARAVAGVNGERSTVEFFVTRWCALQGCGTQSVRAMRMYRLGELKSPTVPGTARLATNSDLGLVVDWLTEFHAEAAPGEPPEAEIVWTRRIENDEMWLWIDGDRPVAVAGRSRPAAGVGRVGPVYTPPQQRRRGYGSAVTAAAATAALEMGAQHVALYTDLANPTSNSIYQRIGFTPDHDAANMRFVLDEDSPAR